MIEGVWVKSTRSGNNGACVEVRKRGDTVDVRDTKNRDGAVLVFTSAEWAAFVEGVKDGEFD